MQAMTGFVQRESVRSLDPNPTHLGLNLTIE